MITENIWNNVVDILKQAQTEGNPLYYVKNIFQGLRDDLPQVFTPCIILEPLREVEEQATIPHRKKIIFDILIECIVESIDKDEQITANITGNKGIMDMVSDVKNVLNMNRNLNGTCDKFRFVNTSYIFEIYPYRIADITMSIETTVQDTGR